ncbi:MAG: hypothetical protein AVDCRST_MAG05-526 [uncultured Rubrobacteraceae bacterium]|uniref:Uncharacterized protein n=1 Tax=uncultured Rubrobacteraceae bacterium TaxID=349277 RepID=A0A6J4RJL7_9ACTN|nr:MAG: hypothetical protein AVDCRST_MAG05-526 [uncultured Rubrobacteraceae bacterium]
MTLLICASLAAAPALGIPALRRRLARAIARARRRLAERARLRLAAALLDLGNHLMLCDEERRARRLRGLLERARRRGRDLEDALRRFGGSRTDDVTFEARIGSRPHEGNPSRVLEISCALSRPAKLAGALDAGVSEPVIAWRVTNRPSEGRPGPISYSEMPDLERALLCYYAPPLAHPKGVRPAA